jgi:hypothetical protein
MQEKRGGQNGINDEAVARNKKINDFSSDIDGENAYLLQLSGFDTLKRLRKLLLLEPLGHELQRPRKVKPQRRACYEARGRLDTGGSEKKLCIRH